MIEKHRFIKPFGLDYPWLMHWVISFFPYRFQHYLERFLNPLLDSAFAASLMGVFLYMGFTPIESILGAALYVCSPLTFSNLGTGPRITTFTPRLAGEVVVSLVFVLEYLYFSDGDITFLIGASVVASAAFMLSKFAVQAFVFINLFLSVLLVSLVPLGIVLISLVLCLLCTRGYYLKILRQQVTHLSYYFKEVLAGRWIISDRNSLRHLWSLFKQRQFTALIRALLIKNSYFILCYKAPLVVVALGYAILNDFSLAGIFLLAGVLVFWTTSLKWFLFIGEAERYLNYVMFFAALILLETNAPEVVQLSLIGYGLVYYIVDFLLFAKKAGSSEGDSNDRFIEHLNMRPRKEKIATIPYHLGGWRVVYHTSHDWFYPLVFFDGELEKSKKYWKKYPYLDPESVDELMAQYCLDSVYIDKKAIENELGEYRLPSGIDAEEVMDGIYRLVRKRI